jgi:ureidoglycolate dehydrogenase (NAD+)
MSITHAESVHHKSLQRFCSGLLLHQGLLPDDADYVADSLVCANLRGTDSHGVARLPHYIRRLRAGSIQARPKMRIAKSKAATAVLDGGHGLGQLVNRRAVEIAIQRSEKYGAGWVALTNSSHCGALAYFGHQLAQAGKIGFVFSHVDPMVLPHGAKQPFHGTNPLCIAVAGARSELFCLDIATSIVPWNFVENARIEGRRIQPDLAVDEAGKPTTDPGAVHALYPFGAHRGSGLGLAIDLLCSMLGGSPFGPHIPMMYGDLTQPRQLGGLVGALDIAAFTSLPQFKKRVSQFMEEVRALPPMGTSPVMVPDDAEKQRTTERKRIGIPLSPAVLDQLQTLGAEAGLKPLAVKNPLEKR